MNRRFCLFNLIFLTISAYFITLCDAKPPVVIVPGDGGSRLEARLNKKTAPHVWCEKHTKDFFGIWLSVEELLPEVVDCWSDNMRLVFNMSSKQLTNPEGVEIRAPYFGTTEGIEYLDSLIDHPGEYFAAFVDALVKIGYVRGKSIRAAPYDFRHAPNSNKDYLNNLQQLIEQTTIENNNDRVVLISHSLGCPYTKYFLDHTDQSWKDKHLHSWITIAGVWGGAAKLFRVISSGTNLGVPLLEPIKLRASTQTFGSSAYLLPSDKFWKVDEPIVHTPSKNYSLSNLATFYQDLHFEVGQEIKNQVPPVWSDKPPNVTLYCLYGTKVPTPEKFYFGPGEFPDTFPKTVNGDGDGSINRQSLEGCKRYVKRQIQEVTVEEFPGAEHRKIIRDQRLIDYVVKVLDSID